MGGSRGDRYRLADRLMVVEEVREFCSYSVFFSRLFGRRGVLYSGGFGTCFFLIFLLVFVGVSGVVIFGWDRGSVVVFFKVFLDLVI